MRDRNHLERISYYDLQKKLKGFFYYQSRQKNIVIDHNVNGILERILVAHELGHAVLHTKIAMMHGFQEMEVFDDRSIEENEANFFAAELLIEDGEVLECLSEHTFFETAITTFQINPEAISCRTSASIFMSIVTGALYKAARVYCLGLRILVVLSLKQSST